MNVLDLILCISVGGFVLAGFWFGLIHMVGALFGMVAGVWIAGHYNGAVTDWLASVTGWNANLLRVLAFVLTYAVVARLFGIALWFVQKVFDFIAIIPFLKTFNRLLGAALGLIEGLLAVGIALFVLSRFPVNAEVATQLAASQFAPRILKIGSILAPLLPDALRALQSVI